MFIKPKKSLSQNFLIDRNVLEQIVDTVEIKDKEVLFKDTDKKIWYLAKLPANRGQKLKINYKISFKNILDAEWYVFKKRWKKHTGKALII